MKVMDAREIEKRFGITDEQLDAWEKDASEGILHGEPCGEVVVGKQLKFGEEMQRASRRLSEEQALLREPS
ncbi:hypothetical protein QUW41_07675 [Slackia piriformis]|nr:hypothetical protein [Slackia piriformis]